MNVRTSDESKPVRVETIDGHKFQVYVDEAGLFFVNHEGESMSAESVKQLRDKLTRIVRTSAVRLKLAACLLHEKTEGAKLQPSVEDVVITGIHGRTGNVLVKRADGTTDQLAGWRSDGELVRQLTAKEKEKFIALLKARDSAAAAYDTFMESLKFERGAKGFVQWEVEKAQHAAQGA